jgi:hypothetical protein
MLKPCGKCNCGESCPGCRFVLTPGLDGEVYPCGRCGYEPTAPHSPRPAMSVPDRMVPIPVGAFAREALSMPFDHFGQFVRLATVPLLITGVAQFVGGLLVALTANSAFYLLWWLIFGLVTIPFCVGWTRFAVLGSDAMRDRSWLSHGTRELKYLAFSLALTILLFGPSAFCVYVSYARGWSIWLLLLGAAIGLATIWAAWRLTFALPAIALDSFQGLQVSLETDSIDRSSDYGGSCPGRFAFKLWAICCGAGHQIDPATTSSDSAGHGGLGTDVSFGGSLQRGCCHLLSVPDGFREHKNRLGCGSGATG